MCGHLSRPPLLKAPARQRTPKVACEKSRMAFPVPGPDHPKPLEYIPLHCRAKAPPSRLSSKARHRPPRKPAPSHGPESAAHASHTDLRELLTKCPLRLASSRKDARGS